MGWKTESIKNQYLDHWESYFTRGSQVSIETLSRVTGIAPEIIEGFRVANNTLDFTRVWKTEIKKLAEGIPIQDTYKRSAKDLIGLIYVAVYLCLRYQIIKGPTMNDWMAVIRSYVNGKEKYHIKYYPPVKEVIDAKLRDVNIRRLVLYEKIKRIKNIRKPRRNISKGKIHIEFVVVNAIYYMMKQILDLNSKELRYLLISTVRKIIEAYRQDERYDLVGKWTIMFLNGYINKVAFEERKYLTQL